jgi:hypothetical protein
VRQLSLAWNAPAVLTASLGDLDVHKYKTLVMRTGVNFTDNLNGAQAQDFVVTLVDRKGKSASVNAGDWSGALSPPPGTTARAVTLNGVRVPLTALDHVDLHHLAAVNLSFGGRTKSGSIELAQLAFQET